MNANIRMILASAFILTAGMSPVTATAAPQSSSIILETEVQAKKPLVFDSETSDFGTEFATFQKDQQIDETVLYDDNDVRITATGLTYGYYEAELGIKIENNSDRELKFLAETLGYSRNAVNGFMIEDGYVKFELAPGESGEDTIGFSYNELLLYGINEIADIQVGFDISDDNYNHLYTGPLQVRTALADTYDYESGNYAKAIKSKALQYTFQYSVDSFAQEEVYNSGNIQIISEAYMTNQDGDHSLIVEVKNDNDFTVFFKTSNITVNGTEIYDSTWSIESINGHCRCLAGITLGSILDEDEWAEYGIDKVDSIGFTVNVINEDNIIVAEPETIIIEV